MRTAATIVGLLVLLSTAAYADSVHFYPGGEMSFTYMQIPPGPISGTFFAQGDVSDPQSIPPPGTGATSALAVEIDGMYYLLIVGGFGNADRSADIGFVFIMSPTPIGPGVYPLDPVGFTTLFGFLDDASDIVLPGDLTTTDWVVWVSSITAAHKFLGTSGSVVITVLTPSDIQATFAVTAGEFGGGPIIGIPDGYISVGTVLDINQDSWGAVKNLYSE